MKVIGQDFGARFIHGCEQLQNGETLQFAVSEGSEELADAKVDPNADITNIVFKQVSILCTAFHPLIS